MDERRKAIRRSNDRLRMIEEMEQTRQQKMRQQMEKLMEEKVQREEEQQRKKDSIRLRKT